MKTFIGTILILALAPFAHAAEVPKSPYVAIVYRYADTILKSARDTYGRGKTGFLLSALDRKTFAALPDWPIANPKVDENLLRILYTLSELSGKPIYRDAAERDIRAYLANQGEGWNVITDESVKETIQARQTVRPWILWERSFELEPDLSKKLLINLGVDPSARITALAIRGFASAYQSTHEGAFLRLAENYFDQFDKAQAPLSSAENLSIAIDTFGAATRLPEPLASRLRSYAAGKDDAFCALAHDLKSQKGFLLAGDELTPLWTMPNHRCTTAMVGMLCVSRYENTANIKFRELIHSAADAYRDSPPPANDDDAWPMTFGQVISLELAAWRSTARQEYLDAARKFADIAIQRFFGDNPLPRANTHTDNYDNLTGSDTLVLSLLELHLSILHITAVRCPSNTIDR
jgi:hypothetical protein